MENEKKYLIKFKNQRISNPLDSTELKKSILENNDPVDKVRIFPDGKWKNIEYFNIDLSMENDTALKEQSNNTIMVAENLNNINEVEDLKNNTEEIIDENNKEELDSKNQVVQNVESVEFSKENNEEGIEEQLLESRDENSTQFLDLNQLKYELNSIDVQNTLEQLKKKDIEKKSAKKNDEYQIEDEIEEDHEVDKKKKKKIVIIAIVAALLIILFTPDQKDVKEENKYAPLDFKILYPIAYDKEDKLISGDLAQKAYSLYTQFRYDSLIMASKFYREAVENDFKNDELFSKLIATYAELIPYVKNDYSQIQMMFKLIQIKDPYLSNNPDFVTAKAIFFNTIEKYSTSVSEIKKYLQNEKNKPSFRLFSVFLKGLVLIGDFEQAEKIYSTLISRKDIFNPLVFKEMIEYLLIINEKEKAVELLQQTLTNFPNNTSLLLILSEIQFSQKDYVGLKETLNRIKTNNFENSKYYYSNYLVLYGNLLLIEGKAKEAAEAFKVSVKNLDDIDIRNKISKIDESKYIEAKDIILESRAIELITRSKKEMELGNWNKAVLFSINAVDIAPDSIEAKIYLTQIYLKQGQFQKAIDLLTELLRIYPLDERINFELLNAYVESFQFTKAKNLISSIGNSDLRNSYKFYSIQGKMYSLMGLNIEAIKWFQSSINHNPLNSEDYYNLALEYFKLAKKKLVKDDLYSKSKFMFTKAIELQPDKVDYRVSYSKIIYEENGADAAIGYLREIMKDFPYNIKILSEIAINYFKVGNLKKFEEHKKMINELPDKKTDFYSFLVESSLIDEKYDDVIKFGNELIVSSPGNLKTRMLLGEILLARGNSEDINRAFLYFKDVRELLRSYPKVNLNIAKISKMTGDIAKAKELIQEEIKHNPEIIDSYIEMADILVKENNYIEAEKFYTNAQQKAPGSVQALMGMAKLNMSRNQLEVSLELMQKALSSEPTNPAIHKLMGDVYRQMGQSALAIKSYKNHLEFDDNSKFKTEIETYIKKFE